MELSLKTSGKTSGRRLFVSPAVLSIVLGLGLGAWQAFNPVDARAQTWTNLGGPPGYNGQLSVIYGATPPATPKVMYLASGLTRVWSVALGGGAQLQWTALPSTGLGAPWAIDRMVVSSADAPVLSTFNIQNTSQNMLVYFDAPNGVWKASAINNPRFLLPPRIVVAKNGDILASYANAVFASTDGGVSFVMRDNVSDSMTAPAPLPLGGGAVGAPGYATNAVNPGFLPGYTETMTVMPWGELFMGTETSQEWHSYDNGYTWEHVDPLFLEPQRDMAGVPQYTNGHMTTFGRAGNTAGAGYTKDAEILLNSDRNNAQNFYRMNTTGQIVPIDTTAINLTHNGAVEHFGQVKEYHTLLSGETLTCPVSWQLNQGGLTPDGRNNTEVADWSNGALSLASPPLGGAWIPLYSDGSGAADDGTSYYALAAASGNNLMMYTPAPAARTRPDIRGGASPVTTTLSAASGLASVALGQGFTITSWLPNNQLSYSWSARGAGPVTFDDPFALGAVAYFRAAGWYVVTLTASDGQLSSGMSVMVRVLPANGGLAPVITTQPVNQPILVGGVIAGSAQYTLTAVGSQLTYHWYRNGVELTDGARYSGTTTHQLRVTGLLPIDWDASFYCLVVNPFGRVMSNAALLGAPPVITAQPAAAVALAGALGTLSVAADGAHPMRWQWYSINGGQRTAVPQNAQTTGQTSGLTTATPGTYEVDVTNCFGTVTSARAQLTNGATPTFELDMVAGYSSSASGSGLYNGVGGASAPIGITADRFGAVDTNYVFSNWSSPSRKATFRNPSSPQTSVVVTGANAGEKIVVYANYLNAPGYALSVVNGVGGGTTRPTTFVVGQMVQVTAHPAPPNLVFDHWVGGPINGSLNPTPTFAMPGGDTRVTAVYRTIGGGPIDMAASQDLAATPDSFMARDLAATADMAPGADSSVAVDFAPMSDLALLEPTPDLAPSNALDLAGAAALLDGGAPDSSTAGLTPGACSCDLGGARGVPFNGLWSLVALPFLRRSRRRSRSRPASLA